MIHRLVHTHPVHGWPETTTLSTDDGADQTNNLFQEHVGTSIPSSS